MLAWIGSLVDKSLLARDAQADTRFGMLGVVREFARESLAEHEQILRALEDGDADRAARAIEHHRMQAMGRLAETT